MPLTPGAFAKAMEKKAAALKRGVILAELKTLTSALTAARRASSGTASTADLKAAGHPYARRAPNAAYDPSVVNIQSGRFARSWVGDGPKADSYKIVTRVFNVDPVAKYMLGTRRMIERPVQDRIENAVQPKRLIRLKKALTDALNA